MFKRLLAFLFALIAAAAFAAVDVNKANEAELDSIKGIGPAIAGKILDERKKGNFKDWNDLIDRVKGVGPGNAAKFSADGLTVNGEALKGAPAAAKTDKPAKAVKAAAADKPAPAEKAASAAMATPVKAADDKAAKKADKAEKAAAKKAAKAEAAASAAAAKK